mmetsp:Transcript_6778/g.16473  ORF Transcript_6778/g.16473 Transcript_6778/m.16473 type:complete len:240 (+) Transcript_6778:1070-1789(+)
MSRCPGLGLVLVLRVEDDAFRRRVVAKHELASVAPKKHHVVKRKLLVQRRQKPRRLPHRHLVPARVEQPFEQLVDGHIFGDHGETPRDKLVARYKRVGDLCFLYQKPRPRVEDLANDDALEQRVGLEQRLAHAQNADDRPRIPIPRRPRFFVRVAGEGAHDHRRAAGDGQRFEDAILRRVADNVDHFDVVEVVRLAVFQKEQFPVLHRDLAQDVEQAASAARHVHALCELEEVRSPATK